MRRLVAFDIVALLLAFSLHSTQVARADEGEAATSTTPQLQPRSAPPKPSLRVDTVTPAPVPGASTPVESPALAEEREVKLKEGVLGGAMLGGVLGIASSVALGFAVGAASDDVFGVVAFGLSSFVTTPLGAGLGARIGARGGAGQPWSGVKRAFLFTSLLGGVSLLAPALLGVGGGEPVFGLLFGFLIAGIVNTVVAPTAAYRGFLRSAPRTKASPAPLQNDFPSSYTLTSPSAHRPSWSLRWSTQF